MRLERLVNSMPKNSAAHLLIRASFIAGYIPIDAVTWLFDTFSMVRLNDMFEMEMEKYEQRT